MALTSRTSPRQLLIFPDCQVDVDQAKDVAAHFQISAMPTFVVLKGNRKVEEMKVSERMG